MKRGTLPKTDLARALAEIVGPEHVLADDDQRHEYASDAYVLWRLAESDGEETPLPDVAVRPGAANEVQAIVRLANDRGTPIVPYGGGTGVMGAATPVRGGIVVDLRRMARLRYVSPEGLVAQVEAGRRLGDLDAELGRHGLMLGHDPWSQPIATVGGAISTDGVGYLAAGYGSMGEQVLALEAVLPGGELLQAKKVSLAAGVSPHRLLVGAEGVFGIITAATIKVFPAPEERSVHAIEFPSFESGFRAILAMRQRGVSLSMLDYSEEPLAKGDGAILYFAIDGFRESVAVHRDAALRLCSEHGGRDLGREAADRFWEERHESAHRWTERIAGGRRNARVAVHQSRPFDYLHLAVPADEVLAFRGWCRERLAAEGVDIAEVAVWGRPDLFSLVIVGAEVSGGGKRSLSALSEQLIRRAQEMGGTMEYCHGVGLKLQHLMGQELGGGMDALRALKRALDPNGIMNPGKLGLT